MTSSTREHIAARLAVDLPVAVRDQAIVPFLQPQISVSTREVIGVEVLSRWTHPELGVIPPAVFIPIAEETGAIHGLGRLMLRACCRVGAFWQQRSQPLDVAVNVAPSQLATETFYAEVREELADSGIDPHRLTVEVTEATVIDDPVVTAGRLDRLRDLGVVVSIDDFGAGHSSLRRVTDLRATELKLDRKLVAEAATEKLAQAAIEFAHRRGMRTVGEGVETKEQLARLQRLGCDRAQGYLIAKPVSETRFSGWMRETVGV
ncbi:EAL domain-containing protein [Leifsonia sp. NPDC058292]|uniref:EAL domain-containing protein n=1 Tax=Leifsonia sp. NPDC058292 TaxID=3346428 RepID=UPI0036DAE71C